MMGVPSEKFMEMVREAQFSLDEAVDYAYQQSLTPWPVADEDEIDLLRTALNLVKRVTR
jgi:hypothetical protein